jgi:hypothetical protein
MANHPAAKPPNSPLVTAIIQEPITPKSGQQTALQALIGALARAAAREAMAAHQADREQSP